MSQTDLGPQPLSLIQSGIGQQLSHTDKEVREKAVARLVCFLETRPDLDSLEYEKIAKAIFFCMWMADGRAVQQNLAVELSTMMTKLPMEIRPRWVESFMKVFLREYHKLDRHRMDKYLLWIRIFASEIYCNWCAADWDLEVIKAYNKSLQATILRSMSITDAQSTGPTLHFIRVLWDELTYAINKSGHITAAALMEILRPYLELAKSTYIEAVGKRIHTSVIESCAIGRELLLRFCLSAAQDRDTPQANRERLYASAVVLEGLQESEPHQLLDGEEELCATLGQRDEEGWEEVTAKKKKTPSESKKRKRRLSVELPAGVAELSPKQRKALMRKLMMEMVREELVEELEKEETGGEALVATQTEKTAPAEEKDQVSAESEAVKIVDSDKSEAPKKKKQKKAAAPKDDVVMAVEASEEVLSAPVADAPKKKKQKKAAAPEANVVTPVEAPVKEAPVPVVDAPKKKKKVSTTVAPTGVQVEKKSTPVVSEQVPTQEEKKVQEVSSTVEVTKKKKKKVQASPEAVVQVSKKKVELGAKAPTKKAVLEAGSRIAAKTSEPIKPLHRVKFNLGANSVIRFRKNQAVGRGPLSMVQLPPKGVLKRRAL